MQNVMKHLRNSKKSAPLLLHWAMLIFENHLDNILTLETLSSVQSFTKIKMNLYTIGYFLKNRTNFNLEDKLSPVYNMASSGLKKMLDFVILYTHKNVSENVCPVILLDTKNR